MDGRAFLDTARLLRDRGSQEADFRSSVSRAYFACYLEIRRVMFRICQPEWDAKNWSEMNIEHQHVKYCLAVYDHSVREIGDDFRSLHSKRKYADYKIDESFEKNDAEDGVVLAETILSNLDDLNKTIIKGVVSDFIKFEIKSVH